MKIFSSTGQMESSLVVNQPRLLLVGGRRVCLVRTAERLLAVADRCPHNGESLSGGKVNYLGEVVCPLHGHRFNLLTGRASEQDPDLETFPTRIDAEGVYIAF